MMGKVTVERMKGLTKVTGSDDVKLKGLLSKDLAEVGVHTTDFSNPTNFSNRNRDEVEDQHRDVDGRPPKRQCNSSKLAPSDTK